MLNSSPSTSGQERVESLDDKSVDKSADKTTSQPKRTDSYGSRRGMEDSCDRRRLTLICFGALVFAVGLCLGFIFSFILSRGLYSDLEWEKLEMKKRLNIAHLDADWHKETDDDSVAQRLQQQVRVLCWVTFPANHEKKANHVAATWGKRCNKLLFMSSETNNSLGTVKLDVKEGRNSLWAKTKSALLYIHEHHRDDADWFLKADDDTYVVVENLRFLLSMQNSSDPIYFGCQFLSNNRTYASGGGGYVLSKTALDLVVNEGLTNKSKCYEGHEGSADLELGKCLENVGVLPGDSRDKFGRGRFFAMNPMFHIAPQGRPGAPIDKSFWYWRYIVYDAEDGLACCSDHAVTFHYISPVMMYVLEYLIYHLRVYGVQTSSTRSKRGAGRICVRTEEEKLWKELILRQ